MKSFIDNLLRITDAFVQKEPWKGPYAKSVFWSFGDKGIKFLAELLIGFYVATSLGVADFGILNYAISFTVLFQGISTLGLSDLITRELVNFRDKQGSIVSTAVAMRLAASLLFGIIINVAAWKEEGVVRQCIFAISLSLIFRSFEVLIYYFQSVVKSILVSRIQIVATILISITKIVLIALKAEIIAFAWVYSFEWILIAIGLVYVYQKAHPNHPMQITGSFAKRLLLDSWPLMVSSAAISIYMRMDQVLIRKLHGDVENGYYAAALRLTEIWYVIPTVIGSILFPAVLSARNTGPQVYENRLLKLNSFMFWISFFIACVISPFSEYLIVNLYSQDFRQAGMILSIQIWSGIFTFMGVSGTFWLMAENLQFVSLIRTLIGLLVNTFLNFALIPRLGGIGAAISMLITQVFATTISLLFLRRTRPILKIQLRSIYYPFALIKKHS